MIFLDTTILVGAADSRDELHADGRASLEAVATGRLGGALLSDFVLDETATILAKRRGIGAKNAAAFIREVLKSRRVRCIYVDAALFDETLTAFPKLPAGLSFTDATSVVVMRREDCKTILSHDAGFDKVRGIVRQSRP